MNDLIKKNSRSYVDIKQDIKKLIQSYYPDRYNDFNEASLGMMMVDIMSAIGDNINFYIDEAFQESNLTTAELTENIYALAQSYYGYKPNVTNTSHVYVDISMVVPAISGQIDSSKVFNIKQMSIWNSNEPENKFINDNYIRFDDYNNPNNKNIDITVENSSGGISTEFRLTKRVKFISAEIKNTIIEMPDSPIKYYKLNLPDTKIIEILDVIDITTNEKYYEVESLAQNYIYQEEFIDNAYKIKAKEIYNKFKVLINPDNTKSLIFGSGVSNSPDEYIVPNVELLQNEDSDVLIDDVDTNLDPSNFLYTRAYGKIPYNTSLQITYMKGGGLSSNILENTLDDYSLELDIDNPDTGVFDSIEILNNTPAIGGSDGDSIESIKEKAINYYNSHKRVVTNKDFIISTLTMPEKYGNIAKVYVENEGKILNDDNAINTINLYALGLNNIGELTTINDIIKNNLKEYLKPLRMLTDGINIVDANIINIELYFTVSAYDNYNKNLVLYNSIEALKKYFNISKWNINQAININEIYNILNIVDGVRYVKNIYFKNIWQNSGDLTYSGIKYDLSQALVDNILYPPLDPSIFYIKYPEKNIKGNVV